MMNFTFWDTLKSMFFIGNNWLELDTEFGEFYLDLHFNSIICNCNESELIMFKEKQSFGFEKV